MPQLIERIAKLERQYNDEIAFSKFLKLHGDSYTEEEFITFLRRRYELINLREHPDYLKHRYKN